MDDKRPDSPPPTLDRSVHAAAARVTQGISPYALAESQLDWLWHFAWSPGLAVETASRLANSLARIGVAAGLRAMGREALEPFPRNGDPYERDGLWAVSPYAELRQFHAALADAASFAIANTRGVSPIDRARMLFIVRQLLDAASP
jgi:polyhydroxyalkanoate synthase